jgi:hypothetical protein
MMAADIRSKERRSETRLQVAVAAEMRRSDGLQRVSLVRDISPTGARLLVASNKFCVGDAVRLSLFFAGSHTPDAVTSARLLRVSAANDAGIWKAEIAVSFDTEVALAEHALS